MFRLALACAVHARRQGIGRKLDFLGARNLAVQLVDFLTGYWIHNLSMEKHAIQSQFTAMICGSLGF
jgi:hypothetical protein